MSLNWDCSELTEAASLLAELMPVSSERTTLVDLSKKTSIRPNPVDTPAKQLSSPSTSLIPTLRSDRLEDLLRAMCLRGGFIGAVIADQDGLPLAEYESPVEPDKIAAFTTVLGESLARAEDFLNETGANNISMDINYTDKVVLRRFYEKGLSYHLLVICPQNIDERSEMELSQEQFISLIS